MIAIPSFYDPLLFLKAFRAGVVESEFISLKSEQAFVDVAFLVYIPYDGVVARV